MDKGAHYHRTDLQVHTPRDRQWFGNGATLEEERRVYAAELVATARQAGLSAVAITDHHDMALVDYVRAAAETEIDAEGRPLPVEQRLAVFPGMELTLGVPCQALLIFDANFPTDLFSLVLNALAITPAPATESRTAETVRLDRITSLESLYEELDRHAYLKGRYIVLPNVSERGNATLLRSGHAGHYRSMPCVGGYLDGTIDQLREGNTRILNGLDPQYGAKSLGLFQTSDSRRRDFSDLGSAATWIKWAEPTAEAIRQACLAKESRLSQSEPTLPSAIITSIDVSNSSFLGPLNLEINPQYTALIGGRGTGKSTVLEYLRWGVCDDTLSDDEDSIPADRQKRRTLIDQTLNSVNGTVQIRFLLNGVEHIVRRNASTKDVSLKIGTGSFEPCKDSDVRALLPIQAYSQKQLSNVGVRLEELRRFIKAPIKVRLDDLGRELNELAANVRSVHAEVQAKRQIQQEVDNDNRELRSLEEQASVARNALSGLSVDDQAIIAGQPAAEQESQSVADIERIVAAVTGTLEDAQSKIVTLRSELTRELPENLQNRDLIQRMKTAAVKTIDAFADSVDRTKLALMELDSPDADYTVAFREWQQEFRKFSASYDAAKARSTVHQAKLTELNQVEARTKTLRGRLSRNRSQLSTFGNPELRLAELRERWCLLHEQRSDLTKRECERLTELSAGQIKASLRRGSTSDAMERLRQTVSGSNIRKEKFGALSDLVSRSANPIRQMQRLLDQLEELSLLDPETLEGVDEVQTDLLSEAGFTSNEIEKIARKLSIEAWVGICVTPLEDQPVFEYKLREAEYIPFAQASAGQQATALLWALLNQEGPPLLIDQPEDDLDNQIVLRVVEEIWKAKKRRQLIFSSHNANVVVNGDADLVVCFDYRVSGEQAGGQIRSQGAIDVEAVRTDIATVMEGGPAAFKLRKDKYGF